jgi:hypothetical protein
MNCALSYCQSDSVTVTVTTYPVLKSTTTVRFASTPPYVSVAPLEPACRLVDSKLGLVLGYFPR